MLESFLFVATLQLLLLQLPDVCVCVCVCVSKRKEADGYMLEECVGSYDKKKTHQVIVVLVAEMKNGGNKIVILPKSWSTDFCE